MGSAIVKAIEQLEAERDALRAERDALRERLAEASVRPPPPRRLKVLEVAELARCDHKTVRGAIASAELPASRVAGKFLVREDDAVAWIDSRAVRARAAPAPRPPRARRERRRPGSVANLREL